MAWFPPTWEMRTRKAEPPSFRASVARPGIQSGRKSTPWIPAYAGMTILFVTPTPLFVTPAKAGVQYGG